MTAKKKRKVSRRLDPEAKITVLVENPRREGSPAWKRFQRYKSGMTVEAALKHAKPADVLYDWGKRWIKIAMAES